MEESAYRLVFRELVIERHGLGGRQHVHGDLPSVQKIQCLARYLTTFGHSTREHDYGGAVVQQLLHVGRLNARSVTGSCLPPVSIARATGEKPCIFVRLTFSLDLEPAPGNVFDPWRTLLVFHHRNIVPGRRTAVCPIATLNIPAARSISAFPVNVAELRRTSVYLLARQIPRRGNHDGASLAFQT